MSAGGGIEQLALLGGKPEFVQSLHVGRPNIGDREKVLSRIAEILDTRWLTNDGPFVREFEEKLRDSLGVRHCVAMCNATVALEIAARALGMSGEVIVPSFTFVATAHALQWQQITPVFCDIDPITHTIDVSKIASLVTPRTTGIIGVHLWGRPCNVEGLQRVAQKHHLKLLFDSAHALGCSVGSRNIGGYGDAEVFSFHATKFCNSFEGGAVATNNDDLAAKMKLMRNFGFAGFDNVIYIGTNGKMSEASAAMGLTSLECLDETVAVNRTNYALYLENLSSLPGARLMKYDETNGSNYQYVVLEWDGAATGISRDNLIKLLQAENVIARRYFYPGCHRMEPYRTLFPDAGQNLPVTEEVCGKVVVLPTGTSVSSDHIRRICSLLRMAAENGSKITARLGAAA